ncbi:hypothetical protein [Streptomyces sp. NPDC048002]|uniref:hypothetical protein n=1 Tax=Streptomyces sp. NPDC048002 TaxID=3154344 RepID=UPI0033FFBEAB
MNPRTAALGFDPAKAAEHAAFTLKAVPLSAHTVMFPVWRVEVRATVTEAQPYQLIDHYLIRCVAEAGLTGSAELADFLSLDPALVRQALAFLRVVGHIEGEDGSLALSPLGRRSLKEGTLYTVELDDRRVLRFDGCSHAPLTGAYYERTAGGPAGSARRYEAAIPLLCHEGEFRREAVAELAALPDRERYNLPAAIECDAVLGWEAEYVPVCVVPVAGGPDGARYVLCPRPLRGEHDPGLARALETSASCLSALEAAHEEARSNFAEESGRWLSCLRLSDCQPRRSNGGPHRVGLPEDAFRTSGERPPPAMGSLVVLPSGGLFQVWCEDVRARRRELLRQVEVFLGASRKPTAVRARLDLLGAQLEPGPLDDEALCALAVAEGSRALADRLRLILTKS